MDVSVVWTWLFGVWTASEAALAIFTRTGRSEGNVQDRGSLLVLWTAIVASIAASGWTRHALPAASFSGSPRLTSVAIVLLTVGLAIRWTAILSLGRSFSVNVAIHKTQTLYRRGLYRLVRHPSYLGILFIFLAIGLQARNWAGLAILLIAPELALIYRIRVEEQALNNAFGAEYGAYCRTTKRLIPGVF